MVEQQNAKMKVACYIPARYEAARLPGKLMLDKTGKPLILHTYEQAKKSQLVDKVVVATDDERIFKVIDGVGGMAVMTGTHHSGTDRITEAAGIMSEDAEIIVNVQGDEPEIDPQLIDIVAKTLETAPACFMATLATRFSSFYNVVNPARVKVVLDRYNHAMYFSRGPIPSDPKLALNSWLLHLGIYAYRRGFLHRFSEMTPTPLEKAEQLEQLRALEHGFDIKVAVVESVPHGGIDTQEDYDNFVKRFRG